MKNKTRNKLMAIILGLIGIGIIIWWSTKPANLESKGGKNFTPTLTVKVVHPQLKTIPIQIEEVGSVEPEETVNIVSQVSGVLRHIDIRQGQKVTAGQLLFEIDPSVYQSEVTEATANMDRDQAQLDYLKANANRYEALAKLEYVTRQQYEQAVSSEKQQEAVVAADQALLHQKQIQLTYTQIHSPITGKTGEINAHVGDLIPANGSTPLVVINRLDNVLINFNVAQNELTQLIKYRRAGSLKIQVLDESGDHLLAEGSVAFIGNVVSAQTGTIDVKGKVANPKLLLWPGQFVTVRLIFTYQPNVLVIPSKSIQMGQKGSYVYVVKNNKAMIQPITISRQVDSETAVTEGLKVEDNVINEIPPGLTDGSSVKIVKS